MKRRWLTILTACCVAISFTACRAATVPPVTEAEQKLQWLILDDSAATRCGWDGTAMAKVFSKLAEKPDITLQTEYEDQQIANLLTHDRLPELVTVPTNSSLREKLLGSGNWYGVRELSPELYERIPEDIRRHYQRNEEDLYSLPGGYTATAYQPVAAEGVYVRKEYYMLLDSPAMDTPAAFCDALQSFVHMMTENQLLGGEELVPLVFGVDNSGFETVEHLCGMRPLYQQGVNTYHRAFSPQLKETLTFFDMLDRFAAYPIFDGYSADRLSELLKDVVYAYVGPAEYIERFNLENPRYAYVPVKPPVAQDGFLQAQSRYGRYETFVSRTCDPQRAAELLLALTTEEASRTFIYGLEDENWIMVDGRVLPLKATTDRMTADALEFFRQTGIAAFPYLSRDGAYNPYVPKITAYAEDISAETVFFSPTDYHYYYVSQMDSRLSTYYAEVAETSVTAADILERIRVLGASKEQLTVSR